jgi:hypothetical protein
MLGGVSGGFGIGVSGSGRRMTGAVARSSAGVTGTGIFVASWVHAAVSISAAMQMEIALAGAADGRDVERRGGRGSGKYGNAGAWSSFAMGTPTSAKQRPPV